MKTIPPNITPGPWTPELPEHGCYDPIAPDGHRVCFIPSRTNRTRQTEANARAISTTPDTLAALAGLLRAYENKHGVTISGNTELALAVFSARAALIKAGYTFEE